MNDENRSPAQFWGKQEAIIINFFSKAKEQNKTMRMISEEYEIPYQTLSAVMSGHRDAAQIKRENIQKICNFLNISVIKYFDWCGFINDDDFLTKNFKADVITPKDIEQFKKSHMSRLTDEDQLNPERVYSVCIISGKLIFITEDSKTGKIITAEN